MKKARVAVAITFVCVCLAPNASRGDSYSEFRIPSHHWSQWTLDFQGSAQSSKLERLDNRDEAGILGGDLGTSAVWGFDSERLQHELGLFVIASGRRDHRERSFVDTLVAKADDTLDNHDGTETLTLQSGVRVYPWKVPFESISTVR